MNHFPFPNPEIPTPKVPAAGTLFNPRYFRIRKFLMSGQISGFGNADFISV